MNTKERARAVLDAIEALPVARRSQTDPEFRELAINAILTHCVYDWAAVDGKLFPDGNPLALDLKDPVLRKMWADLRTKQKTTVGVYLDAWDGKSALRFEQDGMSCKLSHDRMSTIDAPLRDPSAALRLMLDAFGPVWQPMANNHRAWEITPMVIPQLDYSQPQHGLFMTLAKEKQQQIQSLLASYIPRRFIIDEQSADAFRSAVQNVEAVNWAVWRKERVHMHRRSFEQYHLAPAKPATKSSLTDFLQRRLDKARLHFDASTARDQFTALPMTGARAKSAKTNRTWGIELEIIDAGAIQYDAAGGWKRERDGSLRQQIGDGRTYDPWEFVSPILDMTFSQGLWMICDQAQNTVKYHKAGVHVHVSATTRRRREYDPVTKRSRMVGGQRMTTAQVSRLIELYATVSPMLDPIIARTKTREFCTPTRVDQWANGWFEAPTSKKPHRVRPTRTRRDDAIENAKFWAQITKGPNHDAEATEWKRHQELNLQALNKYGTIEFRSMGAVYDYEYLTRWAWLCRAMVDYAQSDAPMGPIYKLTDFNSLALLLNSRAGEPLNLRALTKTAA